MHKGLKILQEGETGYGILIDRDGEFRRDLNVDLLSESNQFKIEGDKLLINCILQKANTQNRNGRVYPLDILKREIDKYQSLVKVGSAVGECNHPNEINIDLDNISHRIVKMWWEGDTVYGTIEIFISPSYIKDGIGWLVGDKIAEYLRREVRLGISSRGVGSVRTVNGKNYVQDDFELVCFDLVASPSTPDAYLFFGSDKDQSLFEGNNNIIMPNNQIITERNITQNIQNNDKILNFLNKVK
jgi:hypothetical protein